MFTARVADSLGAPAGLAAQFLVEQRVDLITCAEPVFIVRDRGTGLRLFAKCTDGAPESLNRLKSEAAILSRFQHPHLLPLQADRTTEATPYLLFPWQGEQPLSLTRALKLTAADRVRVGNALLAVVRQLHSAELRIAHRGIGLEVLWLTAGACWLRLAGLGQAICGASADELARDRAKVIEVLAQLLDQQMNSKVMPVEIAGLGEAWISGAPEAELHLARGLKLVALETVTADL